MSLERKLAKNTELRQQYIAFMKEYIELGHMEEVDVESILSPHYFLPHHSVLKPDSSTTKLRVVFDASAKTSTNTSLNDILHTGPKLQEDLFCILLRFRLPKFVFTADIQKMYRQVWVQEEDRRYQLIWWRDDPRQPVKCYQLSTVTYGTSPASYLATKCLQQLAQEESARYPNGAEILQRNFYVDDVMAGADSLSGTLDMQAQLIAILQKAGLKLRKWCSNHPQLLKGIPSIDQEVQLDFTDEKNSSVKTLGLTWLPKTDQFCIKITSAANNNKITKRTVASDIAHLFDPLGVLAPVIVTAKIFLQRLWELKLDWDAALPAKLHTEWITFRSGLPALDNIQLPRHIFAGNIPRSIQLHAFADASEKAYGAAVYIRSTSNEGRIIVRLLCSKSRVAPTKRLMLPRLELCAASLAAELIHRVQQCLKLQNVPTYFWTDSEIVLDWINSSSNDFQTFVGNRIGNIQRLSLPQQWRHVGTKENPADPLSRGVPPETLKSCNIWFYGPPFLHGKEEIWPPPYVKGLRCDVERKKSALTAIMTAEECDAHFIDRIQHRNSFRRLQRVTAYILRFIELTRRKGNRTTRGRTLTVQELEDARLSILKRMQKAEFKEDIRQLSRNQEVGKNSSLSTLAPFLDKGGILRVGGRLEEAALSYDAKHPILLPYSHEFTKLIMTDIHFENYHIGPQGLLSATRQRYWPIKGKIIARSIVQHCVRCSRSKPRMISQMMGNLPSTRVQPARPFINTGVDFFGPVWIHYKIRGRRPQKAYIAVFCCFATKAVHFEVVSDLSTEAFLGALKRFIGRRGHCRNLYCDNATNFVGARNQLKELQEIVQSVEGQENVSSFCSQRGIDFHFIPPRAPHFGGLWEAAVKSAKHLLVRTIASASLTYEELETVIIGAEAVLNSRPLTPMSSNPNDLTALTPGHFLVGEPLTASVDSQAGPVKASLLTRWKLVSHLRHEFWRRWSAEYLHELQYRSKWKTSSPNIEPNMIVIIKEENTPVMKWPLGRIIDVHKGEDGFVRVVDVRTATGILRRPIHKLAPLPCEQHADNPPDTEKSGQNKQTHQEAHQGKRHNSDSATPRPSSSRSKRRKGNTIGTTMLTVLMTCMIFPIIRSEHIKVTQFPQELGIHFENLGTTSLITSEWKMIVFYDLNSYWMEMDILKGSINALQQLCELISRKSSCRQILSQYQHLQHELTEGNEMLSRQQLQRQRRGAINIIGNVANALFGVLDEEYAKEMSNTIDSVRQNEDHMMTLLKNQTSIIDSTINIIRKDQAAVEHKFNTTDNQIKEIMNRLNEMGKEGQQTTIYEQFVSLSIQMTLVTNNLQRIQAAIIDVITDTSHGRMNPLLLSPHQLKAEVANIRTHLPQAQRLPTSHENVVELYKLMRIRSRIIDNYAIFQIKLPLLLAENFDLFRILPIPIWINHSFVAIQPSSPYLAVTPHRDLYYPIEESELTSCAVIEGANHLCFQQRPIYHKGANISACEMKLLNNALKAEGCRLTELIYQPVWIQLSHSNQWMFAYNTNTTINIVCGKEAFSIVLHGSGIIETQPDCIIREDTATIHGRQIYSSKIGVSYTKMGISTDVLPQDHPVKFSNLSYTYQPHLEDLKNLHDQITSLDLLNLPKKVNGNAIHHFTVSYIGIFIIIAAVLYISWRFKDAILKPRPTRPQPMPRRRPHSNYVIDV